MKIAIVSEKKDDWEKIAKIACLGVSQKTEDSAECCFITGSNSFGKLKETMPDILIGVNLYGFEQSTLTDNVSFNLLDCKQVHLLTQDELKNEKYLSKQLSIAMFFYCLGDKYYEYLKDTYPNLPYLSKIVGWQTGNDQGAIEYNAEILCNMILEVKERSFLY